MNGFSLYFVLLMSLAAGCIGTSLGFVLGAVMGAAKVSDLEVRIRLLELQLQQGPALKPEQKIFGEFVF